MIYKYTAPGIVSLGGVSRAGDGRIPGQECRSPNSTVDPRILAEALRRGATLKIGRIGSPLDLAGLQSLLANSPEHQGTHCTDQLMGHTALCAHWFGFCVGRRGFNHWYPGPLLAYLIETCFGLDRFTLKTEPVVAGLFYCGFTIRNGTPVERIPASGLNTDISSRTFPPNDFSRLVQIKTLGKPGALPPIPIEYRGRR
jgi:hypothetical protein